MRETRDHGRHAGGPRAPDGRRRRRARPAGTIPRRSRTPCEGSRRTPRWRGRIADAGRATYEARASEDVLGARWRSLLERVGGAGMTRPARLVGAGSAAFGAGLAALAVLQHRAFWTGRFDVGNLVQAVWSTAHGDFLSVTGLTGNQISRLGAHFDPIVAAFAPLWWLWPDASLLLVCQSARGRHRRDPRLPARPAASRLGVGRRGLRARLPPASRDAVARARRLPSRSRSPRRSSSGASGSSTPAGSCPFAVVAGAACLTKEQIGLVVAAMGLWYALRPSCRRAGLAIAVAGTVVSLVAVAVVVPHYAPGGGSPFEGRYELRRRIAARDRRDRRHRPGSRSSARSPTAATSPTWPTCSSRFSALPLLAPLTALTAAPELLLNLLSDTRTQTSIHFHYTAGALPGLFVAAVLGAARLRRRFAWARRPEGRAVVVSTRRRGAAPRPAAALASRAVRLGSRDARARRRRPRRRRPSGVAAHPARRSRERDEHARGPPVRTTPGLQLPGAPGSRVGRGRPDDGRAIATWPTHRICSPSRTPGSAANDRFELVFEKDGILVFRLRAGSSAAGGTP